MKKIILKINKIKNLKQILILILIILILSSLFITYDYEQITYERTDLIRIHIRANSNEQNDQDIKLIIRDEIISFLMENALDIQTKNDMLAFLEKNLNEITMISDAKLKENGYVYKTKISLLKQEFPVRVYDEIILDSGVYDALVIELGKAEGDNWWCIAFPQLCFGKKENKEPQKKVVIKSRFSEWFKKFKKS